MHTIKIKISVRFVVVGVVVFTPLELFLWLNCRVYVRARVKTTGTAKNYDKTYNLYQTSEMKIKYERKAHWKKVRQNPEMKAYTHTHIHKMNRKKMEKKPKEKKNNQRTRTNIN